MVHSFIPSARYSINAALWTIGIETHFYIFYPVLRRIRTDWTVPLLLAAAIVSKQAVKVLWPAYAPLWAENFVGRYWEWALGCVVAERLTDKSYGLSLAACVLPHGGALTTYGRPMLFAVILHVGARLPALRSVMFRWTLEGGVRSYSLYLIHPITIALSCVTLSRAGLPLTVQWAAAMSTSVAACTIFFRYVEKPFMLGARSTCQEHTRRRAL
jgi:peptidoglycan/LPS O-acetylase OafA/YrhL